MVIEKIKDDALRQRIVTMIEHGRNATSEDLRNNLEYVETRPGEEDYAVWVPPEAKTIKISENADRPADMVLPSQILEHFIRNSSHRVIMNFCGCREIKKCKDYPIEYGCLFLGDTTKDIHPELGKAVTVDEALDYAEKCRKAGLIHHLGYIQKDSVWLDVGPSNRMLTICACCPCCCTVMSLNYPPEMRELHHITKMPGIEVKVTEGCVGCGTCVETCTFSGVTMDDEEKAIINDQCMACGRCVEACPEDAMEIIIQDTDYLQNTVERISQKVDCT